MFDTLRLISQRKSPVFPLPSVIYECMTQYRHGGPVQQTYDKVVEAALADTGADWYPWEREQIISHASPSLKATLT